MEWISVKTDPPKESGFYFVYAPNYEGGSSRAKETHDGIMFSYFTKNTGRWRVEDGYRNPVGTVTHWRPLFDKPEES